MFTLAECECLGACVNAPLIQINDDYYVRVSFVSIVTTRVFSEFWTGYLSVKNQLRLHTLLQICDLALRSLLHKIVIGLLLMLVTS